MRTLNASLITMKAEEEAQRRWERGKVQETMGYNNMSLIIHMHQEETERHEMKILHTVKSHDHDYHESLDGMFSPCQDTALSCLV